MAEYFKERNCSICHKPMYRHSDGVSYSCRNFDCPPGNQAAHERSWKLKDLLQPELLKAKAADLTVEEIGLILNGGSGKEIGPAMLEIAQRLGIADSTK